MHDKPTTDYKTAGRPLAVSIALRGGSLILLWWVLTEGILEDPAFVLGSVALALYASYRLIPRGEWHWRPLALGRFLPYFLSKSLMGGIDVASRAFRPTMPLQPEIIKFPLRVSGKPALLMAWIASLLPGTASVYLENGTLRVHVLDTRLPVHKNLRELERRVESLCPEPKPARGDHQSPHP